MAAHPPLLIAAKHDTHAMLDSGHTLKAIFLNIICTKQKLLIEKK